VLPAWPLVCTSRPAVYEIAKFVSIVAVVVCTAATGRADPVQIDLSGLVNSDLTTYTGGSNYPQHGGLITVDGIPFELATIGPQQDTAVIQTSGTQDFSIPVGTFGVTSAYVLVNSADGSCGTDVGEIDFVGSSGTYSYKLTEGVNVRDHFDGAFCNSAGDITDTASFGGGADRLDLDSIELPPSFADQTLESIDFKGFGEGQLGEPFLAAATLDPDPAAVPEPADLAVVSLAAAAMLLLRRRLQ
jgi:hypothetical protein